jgi:hypothetical protein
LGAELVRMATRITRMGRIGADFFGLLVLLDGERECEGGLRPVCDVCRVCLRRGQSLVVWAVNERRGAARECDRYLMGETDLP